MTHISSKKEILETISNLHAYNYEGDDVTVKVMVDSDVLESIAGRFEWMLQSELTQALKELKEEAVELPMSSGDNMQLVPIEVIDNKIRELGER